MLIRAAFVFHLDGTHGLKVGWALATVPDNERQSALSLVGKIC